MGVGPQAREKNKEEKGLRSMKEETAILNRVIKRIHKKVASGVKS